MGGGKEERERASGRGGSCSKVLEGIDAPGPVLLMSLPYPCLLPSCFSPPHSMSLYLSIKSEVSRSAVCFVCCPLMSSRAPPPNAFGAFSD